MRLLDVGVNIIGVNLCTETGRVERDEMERFNTREIIFPLPLIAGLRELFVIEQIQNALEM